MNFTQRARGIVKAMAVTLAPRILAKVS